MRSLRDTGGPYQHAPKVSIVTLVPCSSRKRKITVRNASWTGVPQVLVFHRDSMLALKLRSLILLSKIALLIP
jgi:hypothetical protein